MRLYITLWNMNEICIITIIRQKYFGKIEKNTQINIAVNDLYNTRLCASNKV